MTDTDPVATFFDTYGLGNTSGEKHARRRKALAEAREAHDGLLGANADLATEWEMARAYGDMVVHALRHLATRNHPHSTGCSVCCDIEELIGPTEAVEVAS